ncbi:hypothetical protein K493DRAFT_109697 [Basidiobolus meristosporus CBS 931.73]|uniref:Uncharacterized protein n=1 Tax=Basidiobolus meristosporus CBS 931.73 TaxID=1314790 RepID=A0A1Y1YNC0_9FUNG|nr:hypothetical protein K493DRAFT_109697 [Basidiobolus meristosporus CBS 931.73]|eukprot:ORX99517.1 hypothetical protein K493DRAFT_109697 [Basidiobolus meristosporus CBS 931.73]
MCICIANHVISLTPIPPRGALLPATDANLQNHLSVKTFSGLFGVDRALNGRPILLIGTSEGKVYYQDWDAESSRLLLCTLEEPIVGLMVVRSPRGAGVEDCLVVVG